METCFNYCDSKRAFFSSDERKWINKIHKLIEEHPEDIRVIRRPEENDGCIYVELPSSWLKVSPPRKLDLSEEDRAALRERMINIRSRQENSQEN